MSQGSVIIVRRRKKVSGKGHGSSAWKIAFADFTLSMMAVFLVLWVVNIASPREQALIGRYFSDPTSVFDEGGQDSLIDFGLKKQIVSRDDHGNGQSRAPLWGLFQQLKEAGLHGILKNFKNNIRLELLPQGVRINISESRNQAMFDRGSGHLTPYFEDLLLSLAPFLADIKHAITITGHSDASRFSDKSRMNNWYLSANRANTTRETLVYGGVPSGQIIKVSAMADSALLNPNRPYHSANRRIEIMVLTEESESQLINRPVEIPTGKKLDANALNQSREYAEKNQRPLN